MILDKIILLKSGFAGITGHSLIVDRRIILYAKAIKKNKLFNIPIPRLVKKMYNGKVHTVIQAEPADTTTLLSVFITDKDGHCYWVSPDRLKNYNYKAKK